MPINGEYSGQVLLGCSNDLHILKSLYPNMYTGEPQSIEEAHADEF